MHTHTHIHSGKYFPSFCQAYPFWQVWIGECTSTRRHLQTQASVCKAAFKRGGMTQWSAEKGEAGNHGSCDSFLVFDLAHFDQRPALKSYRELTVCAMVLAYVSAIHDISLSPVLISGAGTSMPGPGQKRWVREGGRRKWES